MGTDRIDIVYPGSGLPGFSDTGWKVWDATRGGWQVENRIAVDNWTSGPAITSFKPGHLEMWWRSDGNSWRKKSYYGFGLWEGGASTAGIPGAAYRARPSAVIAGADTFLAGRGGPDGRTVFLRTYFGG